MDFVPISSDFIDPMMPPKTYYLIAGANLGIGPALVKALAQRPDTVVVAVVYSLPDSMDPYSRVGSITPVGSSLIVLSTMNLKEQTQVDLEADRLEKEYSIHIIDVVIAIDYLQDVNATPDAVVVDQAAMTGCFQLHPLHCLSLYQAFRPFLDRSPNPKFVAFSQVGGSITDIPVVPSCSMAQGVSRAALNYVIRRMYVENPVLVAFVLIPEAVGKDPEGQFTIGWYSEETKARMIMEKVRYLRTY